MDRLHCVTALCSVFIETCIDPSAVFNYHPFMGCWIQLGRRWWFAGRHSSLAFGYLFGCCDHPIDTQGKSETWSRSSRYSIFGWCFFFHGNCVPVVISWRPPAVRISRWREALKKKIKKETKKKTKQSVMLLLACAAGIEVEPEGMPPRWFPNLVFIITSVCVCVCGLSINIIKWLVKNKYDDNLHKLSR